MTPCPSGTSSMGQRVVTALLVAALASAPTGCRLGMRSAAARSSTALDSNSEMAATLREVAASIDPNELASIVNPQRAAALERMMANCTDPGERESVRMSYALQLLYSGRPSDALTELSRAETWMKNARPDIWSRRKNDIRLFEATCYLRIGEDQNCCSTQTSDSCLVPIRGGGIHTRKTGSENAMRVLEDILRSKPQSHLARWLLNIAAMTLGKYPEGVPKQWRVDPACFKSDYDIKRFTNIAPQLGLNLLGRSGGAIVDDLDGDGYLDIMVSGLAFDDQVRFFHNNGDATFTERTKGAHLLGETGGLNMIQADYDNDGHTDVFILRGGWMGKAARFPCSLLHNNGDGTFTDVTKKAGLSRVGPTQTAVWLDYNNDGWLDLFVGYESRPDNPQSCALYRNNHDGTFTDVSAQAGVNCSAFVKGVVSADYDRDGWPDILVSTFGAKLLYHNNRDGTFTNVAEKAGIRGSWHSFGAMFFDYDNDGWPDIFLIDDDLDHPVNAIYDIQRLPVHADRSRLYHNNRDGTFTDVTHAMNLDRVILGMGNNFGDLDTDGYLDIYVGTGHPDLTILIPNRMYRNAEGKRFQDVTTSGGFGHLQKGHAIAFADINNDGHQDVFEEMGGAYYGDVAYSTLYANPGNANHWITLKLEGVHTNRCAIGARIEVTVSCPRGLRKICRTVGSGGSFGCNPLRQEIGLGDARSLVKVEIYWPVSRKTQTVKGLAMDGFYHIREDTDTADHLNLKATPWRTSIARAAALASGRSVQ